MDDIHWMSKICQKKSNLKEKLEKATDSLSDNPFLKSKMSTKFIFIFRSLIYG